MISSRGEEESFILFEMIVSLNSGRSKRNPLSNDQCFPYVISNLLSAFQEVQADTPDRDHRALQKSFVAGTPKPPSVQAST